MKRKWYTEPQIVFALQQAEAGTPVAEICRKMGGAELPTQLFGGPARRRGYGSTICNSGRRG